MVPIFTILIKKDVILVIKNSNILITGGTGSFGKALIKELLKWYSPKRIVVYSRDELKQSEMQKEFKDPCMRYFIGDVRDLERLEMAMKGIDFVFHAAALKQVPACEYNPEEAIKTNVIGTINVTKACIANNVKKALLISTDKACAPINLYGTTKACAEKLFIASNAYSGEGGTVFCAVRYGNVIASRGSVIPLFKNQAKSGEITITDMEMTRFFIKLKKAVDFSISSLEMAYGGEVFIPIITSIKIHTLAKVICDKCKITEIGIRPGEKLHECLITNDEAKRTIHVDDRYIIIPYNFPDHAYELKRKKVPKDFYYNSLENKTLSPETIRILINEGIPTKPKPSSLKFLKESGDYGQI